jgi:prepilin-type processing-associated H-X9-DG protein
MMATKLRTRAYSICIARVCLFLSASLIVPCVRADNLPLDLSLIGDEHIGFVQIRLADLWKSDTFAPVRTLVAKAGPEMLSVFDRRFVPAPSTVDRFTLIFAANAQGPGPLPEAILVVTTSQPFDRAKLMKGLLPQGVEAKSGNWTCFTDADRGTALCVLDPHTFALGPTAAVNKLAVKPRGQAGKLQHALDLAAGGQSLVAVAKLESFLPIIQGMPLPPQLLAVAEAQTFLVSARLVGDPRVDCRMEFADAQHAEAGEQGVRFAMSLARQQLQTARAEMEALIRGQDANQVGSSDDLPKAAAGLLGLGLVELADEQLAKLPLERKGEALTLSMELPKGPYGAMLAWGGFSAGLFLPAVQKVREASSRMTSQNNLRQMALAMHNYHDANGRFPAAAICDKAGKPLLSWRVAILPYVEQNDLYNKFHLDEPWDSKHNITLLPLMPAIYAPGASKPGDTKSYYRVFVGPQALFEYDKGRRIADITDGTSNTWLVAEAAEAVPWTKPEELVYDPDKPVPKLGNFFNNGFNVVYADGSVHFIKSTLPEATIRALITHAGGEIIQGP